MACRLFRAYMFAYVYCGERLEETQGFLGGYAVHKAAIWFSMVQVAMGADSLCTFAS